MGELATQNGTNNPSGSWTNNELIPVLLKKWLFLVIVIFQYISFINDIMVRKGNICISSFHKHSILHTNPQCGWISITFLLLKAIYVGGYGSGNFCLWCKSVVTLQKCSNISKHYTRWGSFVYYGMNHVGLPRNVFLSGNLGPISLATSLLSHGKCVRRLSNKSKRCLWWRQVWPAINRWNWRSYADLAIIEASLH